MSTTAVRRLLAAADREAARRLRERGPAPVDIDQVCHASQAALVRSIVSGSNRYVAANCGRQSGKSHGGALATDLIIASRPRVNWLYVTSTFESCKKMAFKPAEDLNRSLGLGAEAVGMEMRHPNGSTAYFMGADSDRTIERLRGTPNLAGIIIDEAGIYDPAKLKQMIEAVTPGLRPLGGKLVVMGTPSDAGEQGTWFEITRNPGFDQHRFDYRDNDRVPSFADVERLIDEELAVMFPNMTPAERRLTAYFQREYLARFVVDLAEKVYQLKPENLVDDVPAWALASPPPPGVHHLVCGDLGSTACDALLDLAWKDDAPELWAAEAEAIPGQDSLAFAAMAKDWYDRKRPLQMPVDPGGLGQKTIRTVQNMFPDVPIVDAVKPPVAIQVKATNLLLPRLRIKRGSQLALELARPTWVGGIVGGEINEHGKHSDLVPTLRYGCIAVAQYLPDVKEEESLEDRARREVTERAAARRRKAELRYNDQARRDALESDDFPEPDAEDDEDWSPALPR